MPARSHPWVATAAHTAQEVTLEESPRTRIQPNADKLTFDSPAPVPGRLMAGNWSPEPGDMEYHLLNM